MSAQLILAAGRAPIFRRRNPAFSGLLSGPIHGHFGHLWKQRTDLHDISRLKQEAGSGIIPYARRAPGADHGYDRLRRLFRIHQAGLARVGCAHPMRGWQADCQFQDRSLGVAQFGRHATLIDVTQLDNLELYFAYQEFGLECIRFPDGRCFRRYAPLRALPLCR